MSERGKSVENNSRESLEEIEWGRENGWRLGL
jgi:hypothetical protein